jgi:hypothetical protein
MTSKDRKQMELLPERAAPHVETLTPELISMVRRRKSFVDAWNFAQDFAVLDNKQVYDVLGVDPSHVTKIQSERASPPGKVFNSYLDLVGNEFPLIWWAESRGYDWLSIRKHRSAEQRRIAELEQAVVERDRTISLMVGHMRSGSGKLT